MRTATKSLLLSIARFGLTFVGAGIFAAKLKGLDVKLLDVPTRRAGGGGRADRLSFFTQFQV